MDINGKLENIGMIILWFMILFGCITIFYALWSQETLELVGIIYLIVNVIMLLTALYYLNIRLRKL